MADEHREDSGGFTEGNTLKEFGQSFHRFKSTIQANELKRAVEQATLATETRAQTELLKELKVGQKDIHKDVGEVKADVHDLKRNDEEFSKWKDEVKPSIEKIPQMERWQSNSTRLLWIIIAAIVSLVAKMIYSK